VPLLYVLFYFLSTGFFYDFFVKFLPFLSPYVYISIAITYIIYYNYNDDNDYQYLYYINVGRMIVVKHVYLSSLKPNEYGKIKGVACCCKANKRLYELGLYRNALVKVVKNDFGPIILNLSGNKLALGRGLASKVMVEPYSYENN